MDDDELKEIERMMDGLRDEAKMRSGDAYWMFGAIAPDVRRLIRAVRELSAVQPEAARTPTGFDFGSQAHYAFEKQWEQELRDSIIEEIAGQTKMRDGVGWCLTDVEIRALKDKPRPQPRSE